MKININIDTTTVSAFKVGNSKKFEEGLKPDFIKLFKDNSSIKKLKIIELDLDASDSTEIANMITNSYCKTGYKFHIIDTSTDEVNKIFIIKNWLISSPGNLISEEEKENQKLITDYIIGGEFYKENPIRIFCHINQYHNKNFDEVVVDRMRNEQQLNEIEKAIEVEQPFVKVFIDPEYKHEKDCEIANYLNMKIEQMKLGDKIPVWIATKKETNLHYIAAKILEPTISLLKESNYEVYNDIEAQQKK